MKNGAARSTDLASVRADQQGFCSWRHTLWINNMFWYVLFIFLRYSHQKWNISNFLVFSVSLSCSDDLPSEYSLVLFVEFYETDENASYWTSRFWRAVNGALCTRALSTYPGIHRRRSRSYIYLSKVNSKISVRQRVMQDGKMDQIDFPTFGQICCRSLVYCIACQLPERTPSYLNVSVPHCEWLRNGYGVITWNYISLSTDCGMAMVSLRETIFPSVLREII